MKKLIGPVAVVVAILSLIGNLFAYYRYSSSRPIVTVNGVPITRKMFDDRVDYLYARPLLSSMIWQQIVLQAADKENCTPTNSDVDAAVAQLERSNPTVVDDARKSDPDLLIFKDNLKSNLALRNLRLVGVTVTAADVQAYYEHHKDDFQLPQQTQTTLVIANNKEDAETAERLLENGVSTAVIAQQQGLGVVGINIKLNEALPTYVGQEVLGMSSGEVKIIPIGDVFGIVKAKVVSEQGIPPLSSIQGQVQTACALEHAPAEVDVLRKLRSESVITADSNKYADAIPDDPTSSVTAGTFDSSQ